MADTLETQGLGEGGTDGRSEKAVANVLLSELLGLLSRPFEIYSKRQYEFAVLGDGIENSTADLVGLLEDSFRVYLAGSRSDMDVSRLLRPLIIHAKSKSATHPNVVRMFEELRNRLRSQGRSLVIYPAHEAFAHLGVTLARDLRSAQRLTGIVPPLSVDLEITEAFCRATRDLFEIQLKTSVQFVGAAIRLPRPRPHDFYSGSIDMEGGSVSISALVTLPSKMLTELVKRMVSASDVSEEVIISAPGEFANIVGGAARGSLNSVGYALRPVSIPRVYTPEIQHLLEVADHYTSVEIRIETDVGVGFLELRFHG
jgi:hypothetical protein